MVTPNEVRDSAATPHETHIFVLIGDRTQFDKINRAAVDHGRRPDGSRVLTKHVSDEGATVVFHHWVFDDADEALHSGHVAVNAVTVRSVPMNADQTGRYMCHG